MKRLFWLLILALAPNAFATTYYVAPTGTNGTCVAASSISTPALTGQFAATCLIAGDTLQYAAGTYASSSLTNALPSGTAGAYTTMKCVGNRTCHLQPTAATSSIFMDQSRQYIRIQDFDFDCNSMGSSACGFSFSGASNGTFNYFEFINNEVQDGPTADGIVGTGMSNFLVQGNYLHDLGGSCVETAPCHGIYAADHSDNWIIDGNRIETIPRGQGIQVYMTIDPTVYNFTIKNNKIKTTDAAGIILYGYNHVVYNNTISGATNDAGIVLTATGDAQILNNAIYNGGCCGAIVATASLRPVAKNNVALGNSSNAITGFTTLANNTTTGTATDVWTDPANNDFTLKAGASCCIDTGVDLSAYFSTDLLGISRPVNGGVTLAWDQGPYEYNPMSVPAGAITLTAPSGGGTYRRPTDATVGITWTTSGITGTVNIRFSPQCAAPWRLIASVAYNLGTYTASTTTMPTSRNTCICIEQDANSCDGTTKSTSGVLNVLGYLE